MAEKLNENMPVELPETLTETTEVVKPEEESLFSGLPSEALAELTPAKLRMIMLWLTGQYKINTIAKLIGVSENTIRAWLMQDAVQTVIKDLQKKEFHIIDSQLKAMRMKALNTMENLMDSPLDPVRFQASKDILDRTGHKAVNEIKVDKTVTTIEQQLKELADVTIDEAEIIDISDVVELIKNDHN